LATILRIGGLIAPNRWTWLRILLPDEREIYDDGLIDAAIGRATNPIIDLTALQVSGAMPRLFSEHDLVRKPKATFRDHALARSELQHRDVAGVCELQPFSHEFCFVAVR
jgi:hypothetical protein